MTTRKFKTSKIKDYLYTILMVLACVVLVTSCQNDNGEEELLINQQERADQLAAEEAAEEEAMTAENAAAVASAANVTYTVSLHSDNVPVPGATVTLTNQNEGGTVSATSDANGNVAFVDIDLGGYAVTISSADHIDSSYLVDFGSVQDGVHYEWVNDTVVVLEQSEASKIEMLESNGLQTATIKGNVEIETDLTNDTPEVPQGITIRANLDNFNGLAEHTNNSFNGANNAAGNNTFYIDNSFSLTEGDIGSADVDPTTGEYSMTVPAQEDGTDIDLLIPLVEADQTLAFSTVDGQDVDVQVGMQPAVFGPDITATTTPDVVGAFVEFDAPPEPGRGFSLIFDQIPLARGFGIGIINDFPVETGVNQLEIRGNPGSDDFQLSPSITVTDPDISSGENPVIVASLQWTVESFNVTGGSNFSGGESVDLHVEVTYSDATTQRFDTNINQVADMAGDLSATSYTGVNLVFSTPKQVTAFSISQGDGNTQNATVNSSNIIRNGEITEFTIANGGDGYTSIPDITVGNEGNSSPATLEITYMGFRYLFEPDNSGVTRPYVVLPEIDFEHEPSLGDFNVSDAIEIVTLDADGLVDLSTNIGFPIEDYLAVLGNQLLFDNDNYFDSEDVDKGRTTFHSFSVPKPLIFEPEHSQTTADLVINGDGEITGLSNIVVGRGYNTEYDITLNVLDGLPGSGAAIKLTNFVTDTRTTEVTWNEGVVITSGGSGYTLDANITEESFTPATANLSITVKNGETKIVNINYGTGARVNDID